MNAREQTPTGYTPSPSPLDRLSLQEKKELMHQLLRKKNADSIALMPMSKGQESLWFIHQTAAQSCAYNVAMAVHIYSPVNCTLLEKALNVLLQRHEVLRTSYTVAQHKNLQQVHSSIDLKLRVVDARILGEEQLHQRVTADYQQPFDLRIAPPLRAHFYQLAQDESVLLLVIHHIAIDAASLWVLTEELAQIYQALCRGDNAVSRHSALSYRDFCSQQQLFLCSAQGLADRTYWTRKLSPDQPVLTLDISRPRPDVQVFTGASHTFAIPHELAEKLRPLARQHGVTSFTLLLATWYCLLARHSGQQDICISSPTSGRLQTGFMRSIGYFVNPVILRVSLTDNPSFADFLQRVQDTVLEALEHQQYPFSSVIEAVNPRRDPGVTPFSQASFVYQQPSQDHELASCWAPGQQGPCVQWAGLDIRQYPLSQQEGQFELELELTDTRDCLYSTLKYNSELFTDQNMAMLAAHYVQLLQSIVDNPDLPIANLKLLTDEECQQLAQWNNTHHEYPAHSSLHELIERQVKQTPHAVALAFEDKTMTYAEMNQRANQLAHFLINRGVGVETKVGVCMDRSFEMVLTLLAVIKAGGAYVPVDPNYPTDRVAFLLSDMAAPIVLTQSPLLETLPQLDAEVVCVDQLPLREFDTGNPHIEINPDNLAYMIYTSGSTGNPKGAMNTHAGICNRLLWMQQAYPLDESDSVLQKTPFSFDVSVWEFFWPLLAGAKLVIARPDGHRDVDYLIDIIRREQITTLHFVPSMLSLFVSSEGSANCTSIRRVICSGEALSHSLQQRFFARLNTELHNLYGPTEAAVDVTAWQCRPAPAGGVVPIGKPIANIQIHVVDKHMQPVPVGVNGELLIGGIGVARGYFNRDQLTASKFIADPFSTDADARLYRTGDLVRYLPDGNIDYLQRMDDQVKLRGFRIELGEVEAMLNSCDGIRESVVVKRAPDGGSEYLLAFAARETPDADAQAILQQLAEKLPAHCVPSALVFLALIPLTPNGKVDRRALPDHRFDGSGNGSAIAPRNEVERRLHRLWRELLQVKHLSITDNFFALGGHSLLAVRLMAAIETDLGQHLPLASLMQNPTIAELAQRIDTPQDAQWKSLVAIQQQGQQTPVFLVPGGGGNVLYFYALAEQLGINRPIYGLQAQGLDGVTPPLQSVPEIAAALVTEIRQAQPQGPYLIGGHCVGGLIAFAISQQLRAEGDDVEQLLILDAPAPQFFSRKPAPLNTAQWIVILVGTVAHMTGQNLSIDGGALEPLGEDEQLDQLRQLVARAGLVPNNTPLAQIRGLLHVFIANAQLHHEDTEHVYPVPISLLRAREINPLYDYRNSDDDGCEMSRSSLGWHRYAKGPVQVQLVEGDHITMLATDQAAGLAKAIQALIN